MVGEARGPAPPGDGGPRIRLRGIIASSGFASGHRLVVGAWDDSPLGRITDVMWATPDGSRILLADSEETADFVAAIYRFDEVRVVPTTRRSDHRSLEVAAGELDIRLQAGPGWRIPFPHRPAWFTRWVEAPIARATLGVHTYGVTASGWREWYQADTYRPLTSASATLAGEDLGPMAPVAPPCRFGFSEPPARPSLVRVRPLLEPPVA